MLISSAYDLEEQLGSGLGEGNISQFIDQQQIQSLELFVESLKSYFLTALQELSNEVRGCVKADLFPLGAS